MNYLLILMYCLIAPILEAQHHEFTVINKVAELDIISLYLWGTDQPDKGDNWFTASLQPDSSVTFSLASGKCNILAFDEMGNSYGIAGNIQKNIPDTIEIDLEYITFGRPNVDHGHHLLSLTNSLHGFALDTLIFSSEQLNDDIVINDFRIFPGNSVIVWLDKGSYSVNAIDQIGRIYTAGSISVPSNSCIVTIVSNMISNPQQPIGIAGYGSGSLLIENCLPSAKITELQITPQNGSDGIYLDSIILLSGASIVANLNPGIYSITATDEFGARYTISFEQQDTDIIRLPITYESLQYDFSFPDSSQEQL